jgi:hypothetical protein
MSVYVKVLIPGAEGSDQYKLDMTITRVGYVDEELFKYRVTAFEEGRRSMEREVSHLYADGVEKLVALAMESLR